MTKTMTKTELAKIVIDTEDILADNVDTFGFDFAQAAGRLDAAKRELADRFGVAVGFGGILGPVETVA